MESSADMNKRRAERLMMGFRAKFMQGGVNYSGVIENISTTGIYLVTAPTKTAMELAPGTMLELMFEPLPGETLNFHCKVKWHKKTSPHELTDMIGMEIINPQWDKSNYFI